VAYVFGPVPSRRLGLSLGVDLTPRKTCTYDCLYCQVGRTTQITAEPNSLVPVKEVIHELEQKLRRVTPDFVTISGSGEPTLHSQIHEIIAYVKERKKFRVAVLTNGSLFWRKEVVQRVLGADVIMPTCSTVFEETFKAIHRPDPGITVELLLSGLKNLRRAFKGQLFLEVMLLKGFNDSEREITALRSAIEDIEPDRVQLNTVARPPSDPRAAALDMKTLEGIKKCFGAAGEIIADRQRKPTDQRFDTLFGQILEMAKRRPVRAADVANALGVPLGEVKSLLKSLEEGGCLRSREHGKDTYYIA
jgi:wyosine [tRNA(Phe)-imidazoG37] synthetase (radical SAM superfamily)